MNRSTKIGLLCFAALIVVALFLSSHGQMTDMPRDHRDLQVFSPAHDDSGLPVLSNSMPEFAGISHWWNTPDGKPLTTADLKGKVVLIDFWTYSCINCLRTLPFVKSLYDHYGDKGLVIVGVHTPEFDFEGKEDNVGREVEKLGIKYPVALDADYQTWGAYNNQYWPAEYLFDQQGRLRHTHFGEGEYDQTEQAVRSLLSLDAQALGPMGTEIQTPDFEKIGTNETYFGLARGDAFQNVKAPSQQAQAYELDAPLASNEWTASGQWQFSNEYAEAISAQDVFQFNVQATKLHLVLESANHQDKVIEVSVDGGKTQRMTINAATLYTVAEFPQGGRHVVTIRMVDGGVRFYSATFS